MFWLIKSRNATKSTSYFDEFWSMTERIGKNYLDHVIKNRDIDYKECEFKCPNKSIFNKAKIIYLSL